MLVPAAQFIITWYVRLISFWIASNFTSTICLCSNAFVTSSLISCIKLVVTPSHLNKVSVVIIIICGTTMFFAEIRKPKITSSETGNWFNNSLYYFWRYISLWAIRYLCGLYDICNAMWPFGAIKGRKICLLHHQRSVYIWWCCGDIILTNCSNILCFERYWKTTSCYLIRRQNVSVVEQRGYLQYFDICKVGTKKTSPVLVFGH